MIGNGLYNINDELIQFEPFYIRDIECKVLYKVGLFSHIADSQNYN
jgi:hypothetical protein